MTLPPPASSTEKEPCVVSPGRDPIIGAWENQRSTLRENANDRDGTWDHSERTVECPLHVRGEVEIYRVA